MSTSGFKRLNNTVVQFNCADGYYSEESRITCNAATGKWRSSQSPCQFANSCESIVSITKGRLPSGWYKILPSWNSNLTTPVYCDLETAGGGWTVFQRRVDASNDFSRNWEGYKNGFGVDDRNFWLGNELVHKMTSESGVYTLQLTVALRTNVSVKCVVEFQDFKVRGENEFYKLDLKNGEVKKGNCLASMASIQRKLQHATTIAFSDSFNFHRGTPFSTADKQPVASSRNRNGCMHHYTRFDDNCVIIIYF